MFVEPTQERDRCCTLLTKLESSLATLYKIIFTKFSNKYLKRRSSMSPDFLKLHIHFQKKNILTKLFLNLRDNLLWVQSSVDKCWTGFEILPISAAAEYFKREDKQTGGNIPLLYRGEYSSSTQYTIYFTVPVALRIANLNSTS